MVEAYLNDVERVMREHLRRGVRERLAEVERVRLESIALGMHTEERRTALREVMYGTEEERDFLEGLVNAYAGSDDGDVVHLLSFLLAGAANIEAQATAIAPLVLRAVANLRATYPWPRLNLCTAVERIGFLGGLWSGNVAGHPSTIDKQAIARLIDEGLDGPPAVRCTAAQLLVSLYLPGDMTSFDPVIEQHLRTKLLAFDGTIPEDTLTQDDIDTLKEFLATGNVRPKYD
ncbi:MAG TPA: hypothetical protein VL463_24205 [Kofleriaceae bacterium]|jgi:hypothetical protein|nr:hypothetical protein [Kofleriaceae bacterium]